VSADAASGLGATFRYLGEILTEVADGTSEMIFVGG
jgi:hypothetical protein